MRFPTWAVAIWLTGAGAFAASSYPTSVSISAQDNQGGVWCVADYQENGEALWIWRDGGSSPQSKTADWPGSTGALVKAGRPPRLILSECSVWRDKDREVALGVGPDGRMWSWWESQTDTDEDTNRSALRQIHRTRRLYTYRHDDLGNAGAAGEWVESWAIPANELWRDPRDRKLRRMVWVGADAWILRAKMGQVESESGGGAVLQHLSSGKPEVISYPLPKLDIRGFHDLDMEADAWGRIWLWGRVDAWPREAVCFIGTFIEGTFDFSPPITGFPEGEITELVMDPDKRGAMAAVKGKGLWQIDFERMAATPRLSPALNAEEEILSWKNWPDGKEVLIARRGGYGAYWGTVWLRDARGWRKLGDMNGGLGRLDEPGVNPVHASRACWSRVDQTAILTGVDGAWGVPLSGTAMRKLDWRVGCETTEARESYLLNDGKIWMARRVSGPMAMMMLTPGELAEAMSREPSVIEYWENAFAVDGGAIWTRGRVGPDRYETRLWRGGHWTAWVEPGELDQGGIFALDSIGRVWRYKRMELSAAVLDQDADASSGYRVEATLRKMLEVEAGAGREFFLRLLESKGYAGDTVRAVVRHGRALVWRPHRFELWREGTWTELPDQPGGWPTEMGFDNTGRVRVRMENQPVRIWDESGGSWQAADDVAVGGCSWQRSDLVPESPQPSVPDWFLAEAKKRGRVYSVPSCFQDASGDWWAGSKAGLLRGRSGRVWLAIRPQIPDPWKQGREYAGRAVCTPDGSIQIWAGDTVTLVPAAALAEPPRDGDRGDARVSEQR